MQLLAVLARLDVIQVEPWGNGVRCSPFAADHDVVPGLVPEVVVERHLARIAFPAADDFKILIEE